MEKKIIMSLILILSYGTVYSQSGNESVKAYNNMTVYFVDNSSGYEAGELNGELKEELKNNLNRLHDRPDNYFLIYACNGEEPKISNSLSLVTDPSKSFLKKYLSRDSDESEYSFDKKSYRENLVDYPVRIKQNLEINIYLSAYAVKRLMSNIEEIPSPLLLYKEISLYLHARELNVKVNVYINKEAGEQFGENTIRSHFLFCNDELKNDFIKPTFYFL